MSGQAADIHKFWWIAADFVGQLDRYGVKVNMLKQSRTFLNHQRGISIDFAHAMELQPQKQ